MSLFKKVSNYEKSDEMLQILHSLEAVDSYQVASYIESNFADFEDSVKNMCGYKKNKGINKDSKGMDFENFAERIKSLKSFDSFEQPKNEYKEVTRFMV